MEHDFDCMTEASSYQIFVAPTKLWSRQEILSKPCPVPNKSGVYAWYFKGTPPDVPTDGCVSRNGLTLLYVGISPRKPTNEEGLQSKQTLRKRLRTHLRGNASGSTLRLTLGCLLSDVLDIQLRRVGSGERMTFGDGEARLSDWIGANAFVTWLTCPEPWKVEEEAIQALSLPLNLDQNNKHPFHSTLTTKRRLARAQARSLPIVAKTES